MKRLTVAGAFLLASCAAVAPTADGPELAITIDDLPVHGSYPPGVTPQQVGEEMIGALSAGGVRDIFGFVNGVKVKDDPGTEAVLRHWRSAGMVLGNHGWSHRHLSEITVGEFEDELVQNEAVLARNAHGSDFRWFRYPFLDEGKDPVQRQAARQVLARHGYRVAAVSMSFGDWQWTEPYARCSAKHDSAGIGELDRMYIAAARESISVSRDAAMKIFGRDIPYVLLMHVSAMSAHMIPQLLALYRGAGFRFVSLPRAESDAAYRSYTDLSLDAPPSAEELAGQKGVTLIRPTDYSARLERICS